MRRIRYLVLAALGVFVALPVAKVHTVGAPWIERIELRNNDLDALQGKGVPGTQIGIYYRQRNFRPGCDSATDASTCRRGARGIILDRFEWCGWLFNGNAIQLGSAVVTGAGTWRLQGLNTQVLPGEATGRTCFTGVLTQIELQSQYGNVSVPDVAYLQLEEPNIGPTHRRVGGRVQFANQIAAGVADGPNDEQTATAPWTVDTDEDGSDLCVNGLGCGAAVAWRLGGGGTFQPPSVEVRDDSELLGPRDQEFGHVMGMIQGHKPGGSVLAVGYIPRPAPVGPAINVNVNVNGSVGGGCDASGGYFDFFP